MDGLLVRRGAAALAVAGAGAGAAIAALALIFQAEGRAARAHVGHQLGDRGPNADGRFHPEWGSPLGLVLAGDSVADSLGAASPADTVGAIIALALAEHAHRAVDLCTVAVVGAKTMDLPEQISTLPEDFSPDITVIVVGGNDLTNHVPLAQSIAQLAGVIKLLETLGSQVVVGTCPDFDTLPSLPQPLREFGGQMSRRLAAAQFKAAAAAGAHPVLLGRAVRQSFLADPAEMFAIDGYHPSGRGYRSASAVMLPAVFAAYDAGQKLRR